MSKETELDDIKKEVARTVKELPTLPADWIRAVHLADPIAAEKILDEGLDYSRFGMATSMVVPYTRAEEVTFGSNDSRFSSNKLKAVVLDMPNSEWNTHIARYLPAPGKIPKERIVGVVEANQDQGST